MKIDFFTFITKGSAEYAEFLKYTCEKFMSNKHEINWKFIESVNVDRFPKGYKNIAKAGDAGHNSLTHSVALNLAQKYVENDYAIFIDADMAILHKNWDDIIVNELNNVDCFGGSYGHKNKYPNFPTVYLFAFNSKILNKVKLDFAPEIVKDGEAPMKIKIKNQKMAKQYGMKEGQVLKCDTGWKIPSIIRSAKLTSNTMPMILMKDKRRQLPFAGKKNKKLCLQKPTHMCEWHYNKKLFATHKQASRNHSLDGKWGNAWKKRIELYIKHGGK